MFVKIVKCKRGINARRIEKFFMNFTHSSERGKFFLENGYISYYTKSMIFFGNFSSCQVFTGLGVRNRGGKGTPALSDFYTFCFAKINAFSA